MAFKSVTLSRERLGGLLEETINRFVKYKGEGLDIIDATHLTVEDAVCDMDKQAFTIETPHEKYHDCSAHNVAINPFYARERIKELDAQIEANKKAIEILRKELENGIDTGKT